MKKIHPATGTTYIELVAPVTPQQVLKLVNYDHHNVSINSERAILLTYHWYPLEEAQSPLYIKAIFLFAEQHPPAPPHVQNLVDTLVFVDEQPETQ